MILRAKHTTTYVYSEPVSICHTEVHLAPRTTERQSVVSFGMAVSPDADQLVTRCDYFGNEVTYFSIHEPHDKLTITSTSEVDLPGVPPPEPALTPAWEAVRDETRRQKTAEAFDAFQFVFESPRINIGREFSAYAADSFTPGRPVFEAALDLSARIHKEFEYDPRATTVTTPVDEVLRTKHGVCQDFAHFTIACLRSMGLPARYVSGYLKSGKDTKGAEASHAWVSIHCGDFGWLDFDPTNKAVPHRGHLTVAWGRDYSDVTPVKGVALGGGEQKIDVAVEVLPVVSG